MTETAIATKHIPNKKVKMKIAIMQPYFLPYLGYFQLIKSVDKFIIYDDVSYIKGGWINRNNILVNNAPNLITVPLKNGKSGVPIRDVELAENRDYWATKILKKVRQSYAKAPHFDTVFPMFESWLTYPSDFISVINVIAIKGICKHVGIKTKIVETSMLYNNSDLSAKDRVIDICKKEEADGYINVSGGRELYSGELFAQDNIELRFIESSLPEYKQFKREFISGLSTLDLLMFQSPEEIYEYLKNYSLET